MLPLRNRNPGQQLAFLPEADPEALAENLVALANASGGLIVVGVDKNGNVVEPVWEEEIEVALREAASLCRPPVEGEWQQLDNEKHGLIGLRVSRSPDLHSLYDGRVLIRSGDENRTLSGDEIRQLANSKTVGDFEEGVVPGAKRDDLDPAIIEEYLEKREQRGSARPDSVANLLFEIGATDRDGNPTVAGMLLFGKRPQAFLPQSGIVFVKFPGTEPTSDTEEAVYGRRDELAGPLARMVERAWNIVWEEMKVGAAVNGLEREELTEYPRFAVREALINAVAHRDYRIRGRRVEIRMYSNRMEIISPGSLPGYITLDNLVEEHFSRNPRIVNGLYQWGYIEELGLGIDRMIEEMVQAGHPPPDFRATSHTFTVALEKATRRVSAKPSARNMNERQTQALTYVREYGSITNREYQRLCPDVTPETLRLDLKDLVDRDILLKIGSKKGTHYILK